MELNLDLSTLFDAYIVRLDLPQLKKLTPRHHPAIKVMIDRMGELSTRAQGLKKSLTTFDKLVEGAEIEAQVLYVMWEKCHKPNTSLVVGILKISNRQLYLYDSKEVCHRCKPISILDFYVHETHQRKGFGHVLYDHMLQREGQYPGQVAIDKPSPSLISFLKKHYELESPVWQSTHYVIYPIFFHYLTNPPQAPPPPSAINQKPTLVDVVDGLPACAPVSDKWAANHPHDDVIEVTASMQNTSVSRADSVTPIQPTPTVPVNKAHPDSEGFKGANYYAKKRMISALSHQSIF